MQLLIGSAIEVVLQENESVEAGMNEAHALMNSLGVQPSQLIDTAYVDLMTSKTNGIS
jgi:adenylate cyclase class IV